MNKFEKVIEEDKLYFKVTTVDDLGNKSINYKLCANEEEFNAVKENLKTSMKAKLFEINQMSSNLTLELNNLEQL